MAPTHSSASRRLRRWGGGGCFSRRNCLMLAGRTQHKYGFYQQKQEVSTMWICWQQKKCCLLKRQTGWFSHRKGYLIIKMHIFQTRKMGITPQQGQWDRRRNWVSNVDLRKGDQHDSANRKQNWLKTTLIVALQPTAWGPATLEVQGRPKVFQVDPSNWILGNA